MSNIIFATKLKQLRKEKGLTMEELANKIGRTKSTISRWEKGERSPKMFEMVKLEQIFGIPAEEIMYDVTATSDSIIAQISATSSKLHEPRQEKVLTFAKKELSEQSSEQDTSIHEDAPSYDYTYYDQAVSAGTGQYLGETHRETVSLPVSYDADFVVPVYGDSMEPDYHDGDYIFVEQTYELSDGDIGVFELDGGAYVKELRLDGMSGSLHSLNAKYDDIAITPDRDFRIIGKVVGRYGGFR
ncbi:S24 family peptidase [Lactococcus insecticola]|uniref:Putative repressor protein-phage associated n=1 Tax=Pseudolactococcus insecticola TaxID=2709158 RepID=A0A6A0B3A5_9LACT|nr:S24 family peptidase [Lactococcus insecticola]GFH39819.1 putative repressor protein - phage associated [Lactococcus insecticola]